MLLSSPLASFCAKPMHRTGQLFSHTLKSLSTPRMAGAPGPRAALREAPRKSFHSARIMFCRQFSSPHGTAPTKSVTTNDRRNTTSTHPESAEADIVLKCPGYQQWQFFKSGMHKDSCSGTFQNRDQQEAKRHANLGGSLKRPDKVLILRDPLFPEPATTGMLRRKCWAYRPY